MGNALQSENVNVLCFNSVMDRKKFTHLIFPKQNNSHTFQCELILASHYYLFKLKSPFGLRF